MHIIEELIAERAEKLMARPYFFKLIKPVLYRLLNYNAAVSIADAIAEKSGFEAFTYVTNTVKPRTITDTIDKLPSTGRCILIANHPTGLADGMAVFQAIQKRRPDHIFLANADALRVIPNARDIIIPVEWVKEKRSLAKTKQTMLDIKTALDAEKCVVIFPSGVLAVMSIKGLIDKKWESSAIMLSKRYKAPIIPLHIRARNSWLYYLFSAMSNELRDITLFQELLNKKDYVFNMTFGNQIDPKTLPKSAEDATLHVRNIVESLSK